MKKEKLIGEVIYYFTAIGAGVILLKEKIRQKNSLHFKGKKTDFYQTIDSMQVDFKETKQALKGQEVIIKTKERVKKGDKVYLGKEKLLGQQNKMKKLKKVKKTNTKKTAKKIAKNSKTSSKSKKSIKKTIKKTIEK